MRQSNRTWLSNQENFQIHLYTTLILEISTIFIDQMPNKPEVHFMLASSFSTNYHVVWQSLRMERHNSKQHYCNASIHTPFTLTMNFLCAKIHNTIVYNAYSILHCKNSVHFVYLWPVPHPIVLVTHFGIHGIYIYIHIQGGARNVIPLIVHITHFYYYKSIWHLVQN